MGYGVAHMSLSRTRKHVLRSTGPGVLASGRAIKLFRFALKHITDYSTL